ncbi:MAG: flagellar biosynthesis anti-sigma factor FlgM [Planctomycetales bacterium]|nr:flagellar biosynthesis anti-sigma factor FlgM [Planctomycetales bacterium]
MQVFGPSHLHGAQSINAPHANRAAANPPRPSSVSGGDQLEISEAAQLALSLGDVPDIREDRVSQIRQAIANGTYETEGRLSAALDALLDEIA